MRKRQLSSSFLKMLLEGNYRPVLKMIKEDDNKMKSNDVIFNVLAFVPIVNTILAGVFGIALIVNNETFDTIVKIYETLDDNK